MKRICVLILLVSVSWISHAQITSSISFERDTVGIGDLNNLSIEIVTPNPSWVKGYSLLNFDEIKPTVSFYQNDTVDLQTNAEFDFLDLNTAQPVILNRSSFERREDGMFVHKNMTRFIAWDIGVFQFPQLEVELDTIGNRRYNVRPLEVSNLLVKPPEGVEIQDTTQMIAPILPIIPAEKELSMWFWFGLVNLAILLAGIILYFYLLKKKEKEIQRAAEEEVIRPAHVIAYEKLEALDKKKLWQEGKIKEYQTELTYTVREYLENRFGIQALESTTGEINRSLKEVDFDPKHTKNLNNILQIADMVKFAKATPEESIHQEFMDKARSLVDETLLMIKEDEDGLVE